MMRIPVVFTALVALAHQAPARVPPDLSGIAQFWQIESSLASDTEPPAAAWMIAAYPDEAERLSDSVGKALPIEGRPLGMYIARAIGRQLGDRAFAAIAGDPVGYMRAYERAADAPGCGCVPLSASAMRAIDALRGHTPDGPVLPQLPAPTGVNIVGTVVSYRTDASRRSTEFPRGRPITLQVWYPAASAKSSRAPYLVEQGLDLSLLRQQYFGGDSSLVDVWRTLATHSSLNAPVASGKHPLVLFSVGLGTIRASYTSLTEDLASHGYIVVLVEGALQGFMRLPDGREVSDTAGVYGTPEGHLRGVRDWARDVSWTLDVMAHAQDAALASIARAVDWSRIGATGHSSGGIVALAACEQDRRIRACLDLDGGIAGPVGEPMADFVTHGLTKHAMILRSQPLYDDTTFARRKMTRAEWEKRGELARAAFDSLVSRSHVRPGVAFIAGTGHASFSDAPFVMPTSITRFGGRIIAPQRGFEIISALVHAFFDEALSNEAGAFAATARRFSEVTVARPSR